MSLDKSAIELIQNTAVTLVNVESDTPAILLQKDVNIQSLEFLQDGRSRFRGKMSTRSIDDFALYATKQSGSECFIDAERMAAEMFFNLGDYDDPGHADHTAILRLQKTSAFNAVLAIDHKEQGQRGIAEWLEDWHANLKAFDADDNELPLKQAINNIRGITVDLARQESHEVGDFKAQKSALETIEAASKSGVLPKMFVFDCEPYPGIEAREFYLRMSLLTGDGKPKFVLRIVRLDDHVEAMAQEFKDAIVQSFGGDPAQVYVGSFDAK